MIARLWDADERQDLAKEREIVKSGNELSLPPLPESWKPKYQQMVAQIPGPVVNDLQPSQSEQMSNLVKTEELPNVDSDQDLFVKPSSTLDEQMAEKEEDKDGKFLGLKFSRSVSGNWMPSKEDEDHEDEYNDYDEFESIKNEMDSFRALTTEEDSDEEFSLKDIDTAAAVGSILQDSDGEKDPVVSTAASNSENTFDLFGTDHAMPISEEEEDVQNAINSILDLPQGERIETPDINNIAGLLDSMDDDGDPGEQDPITQAAVNSIPRF